MSKEKLSKLIKYFTPFELALWGVSLVTITVFFAVFDRTNWLSYVASLIGATSLIFAAKGNPFSMVLMLIFCALYGAISYSFAYYGEMITYLGMTAPMAVFALVAWLKNPFNGQKSQVTVNRIGWKEIIFMFLLTAAVTTAFYFVLRAFGTANLIPSTISVATSFVAAYLTFRRSAFFTIAYASNDAVLIVLWTLATIEDIHYVSVLICFCVFFVNDVYGFVAWLKMKKAQKTAQLGE